MQHEQQGTQLAAKKGPTCGKRGSSQDPAVRAAAKGTRAAGTSSIQKHNGCVRDSYRTISNQILIIFGVDFKQGFFFQIAFKK